MRRLSLLFAALLPGVTAAAPAPETPACAVVKAVLMQQPGRFQLSPEPEPVPPEGGVRWMGVGGFRQDHVPPPALVAGLAAVRDKRPLAACPGLAPWLGARKIPVGEAETIGMGTRFRTPVLALSMPAVSADGREAVIATGFAAGPMAGAGALLYLRREANGWTVIARGMSWIS